MGIRLAKRVQRVKPSPTLAVTARAAELRAAGHDIIGLGAGEPDFDTPEHIRAAAVAAINRGETRYTAVDGTPKLKEVIQAKLERENGLRYATDQIIASSGAKQCLYNLMAAILDPGDEVIVPAPYWVSYPDMVLLAEGVPEVIEAGQDQRFKIRPEQLEEAITDRTRLVLLNSPSNPSGTAYNHDELAALGEVLRRYPDVLIATDDIYEHILWSTEPFANIVMLCPDLSERTVVINGVSKTYAMTGWRLGYAAGPRAVIAAMKKLQSQSTSNPCSVSQAAAVAALDGDQSCIEPMLRAFKERHDYVVERLNSLAGVNCAAGDGTFYCFPSVRGAIRNLEDVSNDVELAEHLIGAAGVALVPGSAFGLSGHVRISYATSMTNLEKGMDRLETVFGRD